MKTWLKVAIASIVSAFGALFAVGTYIETHGGFGSGTEPSLLYLLGLAFGFLASVGVPASLWRWFFPNIRWAWLVALVIGIIGAVAILGIKFL